MEIQITFKHRNVITGIILPMKKKSLILLSTSLLLVGCASKNQSSYSSTSEETNTTVDTTKLTKHLGDAYTDFSSNVENAVVANSFTAAINSTYTMSYSDDTKDMFIFDGVLEKEDVDDDTTAHLTQNIESNGGNFKIEGYYYNGNLYNNYNDVTYYEDMKYSDVESSMLVPLHAYAYPQSMIQSISAADDQDGNVIYSISLNNDDAKDLFSDRYDTYGLNQYDTFKVNSNKITDTFDSEGHLVSEVTTFETSVEVSDQLVNVNYESSVNYLKFDETEVSISKSLKKEQKEYVYYEDIDTSSIDTDTDYDDTEEDTVEKTFKKRLKNRLGYEVSDDGAYQISYNDNEAYIIDFENKTFTYSNYSIRYTYNWKGDVGSMGECTVNFSKDNQTSDCEETTADMIETVKTYFEMELYYCGLSLEDLQAES